MDAVIRLLKSEIKRLEMASDPESGCLEALRHAVSLIQPDERADRQLFTYYLRRLEHEGRGEEPFAHALRQALTNPGGPSLKDLLTLPPDHSNLPDAAEGSA